MKGLSKNTIPVFDYLRDLDILEDFQLMEPRYDVSSREIGEFLRQKIAEEFGR